MEVAVVGLGYDGAIAALCLVSRVHNGWGVEVDTAKADRIRGGRSLVAGPSFDALVGQAVTDGRLHATTSCAGALEAADVSVACVGIPSAARSGTDLTGSEAEWIPRYEGAGW